MHVKIVSHVEVQRQPWKAPKTLHPLPKSTQKQHLLTTQLGKTSSFLMNPAPLGFSVNNLSWVYQDGASELGFGFCWVHRAVNGVWVLAVKTKDGI